jgi:hypothetical protein
VTDLYTRISLMQENTVENRPDTVQERGIHEASVMPCFEKLNKIKMADLASSTYRRTILRLIILFELLELL